MAAKIFCIGDTVGTFDKGQYFPDKKFDETRFRKILKDLILSKKHFSADLLLKEGIKKYFGVREQIRHYKGQTMTDSKFYLRWREEILEDEDFKILSVETWDKERKKRHDAIVARKNENKYGAFMDARIKTVPSINKRHYK